MTTTILIIAHAPLASALKTVAQHTYPECGPAMLVLDVLADASTESVEAAARELLLHHAGMPTLIFCDVFGASPCNAAMRLLDNPQSRLVAGVNVPMLWRTLCYDADAPIDELVARAVAGGTQGVIPVTAPRRQEQTQRIDPNDQAHRHDQQ